MHMRDADQRWASAERVTIIGDLDEDDDREPRADGGTARYDGDAATCTGCGAVIDRDGPDWCRTCAPEVYSR